MCHSTLRPSKRHNETQFFFSKANTALENDSRHYGIVDASVFNVSFNEIFVFVFTFNNAIVAVFYMLSLPRLSSFIVSVWCVAALQRTQ